MNQEDEEFNRIERESKQRMEAVYQEVQKRNKAMDREYVRPWVGLTAEEKSGQRPFGNGLLFNSAEAQVWELAVDYAEAKLKEKNT